MPEPTSSTDPGGEQDSHASASAGSGPEPQRRPQWTSQRAFVIASIAGAVGLGNLWRFPYMVGLNGGGTFIVAYAVSIFAIGLPLFILESSAGSLVDRGPVGVFRRAVARGGRAFGWVIVAVAVVIMSYYFVITGWTLGYFVDAVRGDLRPFGDFTTGYRSVWWFLAVGVLVYFVLWRGTGGVERLGSSCSRCSCLPWRYSPCTPRHSTEPPRPARSTAPSIWRCSWSRAPGRWRWGKPSTRLESAQGC